MFKGLDYDTDDRKVTVHEYDSTGDLLHSKVVTRSHACTLAPLCKLFTVNGDEVSCGEFLFLIE